MEDKFEEPYVNCSGCAKQIKNGPYAKFVFQGMPKGIKYYSCSGDCKATIANIAMKAKKEAKE